MTDEKTAAALAARSERAVADVIARYSRHLYTVAAAALRGVGTEQDAEEAAADAFVYLWEHPEKFDPRRGSLKTWAFGRSALARSRPQSGDIALPRRIARGDRAGPTRWACRRCCSPENGVPRSTRRWTRSQSRTARYCSGATISGRSRARSPRRSAWTKSRWTTGCIRQSGGCARA